MSVTGFNRRRRELAKKKAAKKSVNIEQYAVGDGWYKLPGREKAVRKDEALEALRGG